MRKYHNKNAVHLNISRLIGCLLLSLLGSTTLEAADVYFYDGGTHTINDATYLDDIIYVQYGTTLILEEGCVIREGAVIASGSSRVTIYGGQFGGAGHGAGSVVAEDSATVEVYGGSFGGVGTQSGNIVASNNSHVIVNDGHFGGAGNYSGSVFSTGSYGRVTILGGNFGNIGRGSGLVGTWVPTLYEGMEIEIAGGNFGQGFGGGAGTVVFRPGSKIIFKGTRYDTGQFITDSGGRSYGLLGVTFCGYAGQFINLQSTVTSTDGALVELLINETCDSDGDGILDTEDANPYSDLSPTVMIGECDSGVSNDIDGNLTDELGFSLADHIQDQLDAILEGAKNHGQAVSEMTRYLNTLVAFGIITGSEKGALGSCLAGKN